MNMGLLSKEDVLEILPQKYPFRFIDEIIELDEEHIVTTYRFKKDEFFYTGHFPEKPVTPGVILLEAMAQTGMALGIFLLGSDKEFVKKHMTYFTDGQFEFFEPIYPLDTVTVRAERVFWRQKKIRSKVEMHNRDGKLVATSIVSGVLQ